MDGETIIYLNKRGILKNVFEAENQKQEYMYIFNNEKGDKIGDQNFEKRIKSKGAFEQYIVALNDISQGRYILYRAKLHVATYKTIFPLRISR